MYTVIILCFLSDAWSPKECPEVIKEMSLMKRMLTKVGAEKRTRAMEVWSMLGLGEYPQQHSWSLVPLASKAVLQSNKTE